MLRPHSTFGKSSCLFTSYTLLAAFNLYIDKCKLHQIMLTSRLFMAPSTEIGSGSYVVSGMGKCAARNYAVVNSQSVHCRSQILLFIALVRGRPSGEDELGLNFALCGLTAEPLSRVAPFVAGVNVYTCQPKGFRFHVEYEEATRRRVCRVSAIWSND